MICYGHFGLDPEAQPTSGLRQPTLYRRPKVPAKSVGSRLTDIVLRWVGRNQNEINQITATTVVKKPTAKKPVAKPASNNKATKGEKALAYAKKQLGDPYRRRGTGPNGWDCSGLTMKAWQAAGVKLPHSAAQQYRIGKKISKSDLRSGDLVFFYRGISHVGLYAGNGKVIHAPRPGKQVSYIKMSHMPYMGARRPG